MERPQFGGTRKFQARHRAKSWLMPLAISTAVLLLVTARTPGGGLASGAGPTNVARVGDPAPDFTLQLLDGKAVTLSSLKGKPIVVNFWHSG